MFKNVATTYIQEATVMVEKERMVKSWPPFLSLTPPPCHGAKWGRWPRPGHTMQPALSGQRRWAVLCINTSYIIKQKFLMHNWGKNMVERLEKVNPKLLIIIVSINTIPLCIVMSWAWVIRFCIKWNFKMITYYISWRRADQFKNYEFGLFLKIFISLLH